MKYLFLLYLLIKPILGYSQFYVGESKEVVKSDLIKKNVAFTESALTDTTNRISVLVEDDFQIIWVLDSNDIVKKQTFIPYGENSVNETVRWYNEEYVRLSDKEWRSYGNGRIYKIELISIFGEVIFSITLSPDSD